MFTPFFSIKYTPSPDTPKIAVVVSKKVAKNAVVRNMFRGKIYDRIATVFDDLKAFYIAISPNKKTLKLNNSDLTKELNSALAEANLVK